MISVVISTDAETQRRNIDGAIEGAARGPNYRALFLNPMRLRWSRAQGYSGVPDVGRMEFVDIRNRAHLDTRGHTRSTYGNSATITLSQKCGAF